MIIWAIIPVKPLLQSKTRLARLLTPAQRAALTAHLLANTIQLLQQIPAIDEILVISRDDAVFTIAQAHHSRILAEKPPYQLKTAVTQAARYATLQGANSLLIIPADLPFLQVSDIQAVINLPQSPQTCIICPDENKSGTNVLLLPATPGYQFQYGVNSYQKHYLEAQRLNLPTHTLALPGIAFDLDTEADWRIYQQTLEQTIKIIIKDF